MSMFWAAHHGAGMAGYAMMDAADARTSANRSRSRVQELESRCDKALLVCEALWTLLRDKLCVTEEELVKRVMDLDISDGRLDGKVRKTAIKCAKCKRPVARRFAKCPYCGCQSAHDPFSA